MERFLTIIHFLCGHNPKSMVLDFCHACTLEQDLWAVSLTIGGSKRRLCHWFGLLKSITSHQHNLKNIFNNL